MAASPPNNHAHTQRPSLPIIPLSRCPRVCGDPSSPHHSPPKHHSERSEAVPRNLVARFRPFMLFPPHPIPPPRCSRAEPATVKTGGGNPSFLLTFTPAMPPPPNNHAHTQRPSPIRCPRACGDPSSPHHSPPKHHSERSEAVPRNLAAGSHTPLKPECRRGVPCGRPLVGHPQFCTIFAVIPAQRLPQLSSRMRGPIPIPLPFFPHPNMSFRAKRSGVEESCRRSNPLLPSPSPPRRGGSRTARPHPCPTRHSCAYLRRSHTEPAPLKTGAESHPLRSTIQ